MNPFNHIFCLFFLFLVVGQSNAQQIINSNNWTEIKAESSKEESRRMNQITGKSKTYQFDFEEIFSSLKAAPHEFANGSEDEKMFIELPMPNGSIQTFEIYKTSLLHPKLQAKFPEIQTFGGKGISNTAASIKLELTASGLHAQILNGKSGTILIDPIFDQQKDSFICFEKTSIKNKSNFTCHVEDTLEKVHKENHTTHNRSVGDCRMRVFRLALACTFEYADFHGGTISSVMSAMTTTMNRVNGIFERDASIRMEFIANNDELIFLTSNDPYTNNNGGAMLEQNQTTIDDIIGSANYDIGHVFSTGGGGVAYLRSPCGGSKAGGVTGLGSPVGDFFDVDYVAHEMGHQYGGTHTFNNACGGNRTGSTAIEPGSASTIMGYGGICAPNVQNNSDDYFHSVTIVQMVNFSNAASCPDVINLNNNAPDLDVLVSKNIPKSTPFELIGTATDQDGDLLTYCWEQIDNEIAEMPPVATNSDGPLFRSLLPTFSPSRVFPAMENVVDNTSTDWEVLPGVGRTMEFRCLVRDNNNANGCTDEEDVTINVANNAGPFLVIEPNTNITWMVGESRSINWDVANTDSAPINCQEVNILLSTDGGYTYPVVLAANVPNTGVTQVNVPNHEGNNNRVRIQGVDNIFFDISDSDFRIEVPPTPTFTFNASPTRRTVCTSETSTSYELEFTPILNFDEEVTLSVTGLPQNAQAAFSENSFAPDKTVILIIENLAATSAGEYDLEITASSTSVTKSENVVLEILEAVNTKTSLLSPFNGSTDVSLSTEIEWNANLHAEAYFIEISTSINFEVENIVYSSSAAETNIKASNLSAATVYYWRVLASNLCGNSPISDTYSFQTAFLTCQTFENNDPTTIPEQEGTISSVINVPITSEILDVNVSMEIEHTWIGDLVAKFQNPSGSEITLFDQAGVPVDFYGCDEDNLNVSFDDEATLTRDDFEESCNNGDFAISGNYQTFLGNLFYFDNRSAQGDWTLTIEDKQNEDGGQLVKWSVEICSEAPSKEPLTVTNNLTLVVPFSSEETVTENFLKIEKDNINPTDIQYTITSAPISGDLKLNANALGLGSTFTQNDINNNHITYLHNGDAAITDNFTFDVIDSEAGWTPGKTFNIEINQNTIMLSNETSNVSCAGLIDGQIALTASGGTMPYTYSIDGENFQTQNVFSNLAAGDYTLTVKDANDFTFDSGTITITVPEAITGEAIAEEDYITVNAIGGTGTLTYSIDGENFQTENIFQDLENGSYTITVKDQNECSITLEENVSTNNISATANIIQNINCHDDSNGSISVSVTGGFPPYEYSLDGENFQASNFFENLPANTYTFTIRDEMNFTFEVIQTLSNPAELIGDVSVTDNNLTVNVSGGTGSLTYSIDGNNYTSSNEFFSLANDMYMVYVQDESGCILEFTAIVMYNSFNSAAANIISEVSCFEESDGSINVNVNGGTQPLEYSLDGEIFQMSNFFDMLQAGDYVVTVRDADGFSIATNNVTLQMPIELMGTTIVDVSSIDVAATGGSGTLQYSIDGFNFQNEPSFTNLANGDYIVYIRDENGCILALETNISVNMLSIGATINQGVSCHDENDAKVTVNVGGGKEPYEYSIDEISFQDSPIFENLPAGSYSFTVRDNDGTTIETNDDLIIISNPDPIVGSLDIEQNNVSIGASGGTGLLTFSQDGSFYQSSNFFGALNNGDYIFYVKDENDCVITLETNISFSSLSATFISNDLSCFESNDGTIDVMVSGGTPDYSYSLNGLDFQNSASFDGLPFGEYVVTIKDANDFTFEITTIVLNQPEQIVASTIVMNANITVNANGGTGTLTYSLDGQTYQNENEFPNLDNGSYTISVKDENDCIVTTSTIVSVNELIASAVVSQEVSCFDFMDASITASITGGVEPYTYSIDGENFHNSPTFENLGAGNYNVTIQDGDGFETTTQTIVIANPEALVVSTSSNVDKITVTANGGTGTYQYSLDNEMYQYENIFIGLGIGFYTVYVQDENGCLVTSEVEVSFNNMMAMASVSQQISCFGEMDGSITVQIAGGIAPYEYSLDGENFQDANVFENLAAGMYMIIVRDANSFTTQTQLVTISQPEQLTMMLNVTENTIVVDAAGGTGSFTFSIDGLNFQESNTFMDIPNGTYVVVARDENGCDITAQTLVAVNNLSGNAETTGTIDCFGDLASVEVSAIDGQPPYTFSFDGENYQSENIFTEVEPGIYTIYIRDANDFLLLINNYTIATPDELILELTNTGSIVTASGMGGTGNLLYSSDGINFKNEDTFGPFQNGTYIFYVQDENGCITESEIVLDSKIEMSIQATVVDVLCAGESTGMVIVNVIGGIPPYTYTINSPDGTFDNLPAGEYTITITDETGNKLEAIVTIAEPEPLELTTIINDNDLTIGVTGGTGVYQYSIDGGQFYSSDDFYPNLEDGVYDVGVLDENGCTVFTEFVIGSTSTNSINSDWGLEVFPNPASDIIFIKMDISNPENYELQLINLMGQEIIKLPALLISNRIDVSQIPAGNYFLRISDGKETGVVKLVKQ